ncbi:MAG: LD-carboxypeptidase [Victivallales bacterium]|nr:LD-carboxypeptidase [Victivallales bacterium]
MFNPFPTNIKTIAVIAPSGPASPEQIHAGCGFIEKFGIKVKLAHGVLNQGQCRYLSTDASSRLDDLHWAYTDSDVDLILCARGGFGAAHLLPEIDWDIIRSRSVPLVGYSDISVLHLAMIKNNAGIPVVGPMCIRLPQLHDDAYTLEYFKRALSDSPVRPALLPDGGRQLTALLPGCVKAPVIASNLAVMVSLCGTGFMLELKGKVLLLEDINEPVYKLDRYLTQLKQNGILDGIAGLLLGDFIECGNEGELNEMFNRILGKLDCPVYSGFPFGHGFPLLSVRQNSIIEIDETGTFKL